MWLWYHAHLAEFAGMINSWNHTFLECFHGTWGSFGVTMGMLAQLMVHDSCRRLRCFLCPMLVPRWSINLQTDPVSLNQETSNMKQATLKSSIWKLKHIYQSSNWIEHAKKYLTNMSLNLVASVLLPQRHLFPEPEIELSKATPLVKVTQHHKTQWTRSIGKYYMYIPCNISTNCYLVIDLFSQASVQFC